MSSSFYGSISSPTTDQAEALPRRSELIGKITNLFRVARRQVNPLDAGLVAGTSAGHLVLDADGARRLHRLVTKLVSHEYFEHLSEQEIELALMKLVGEYQAGQRDAKMAANFIDQTAKAPCQSRVFFGVRHLTLPQTVDLGIARFLTAGEADFLRPVLGPDAEGHTLANLARPFRDRVDTALEWMEVASTERSWKVKIPAIFSAIEALLVPEDCPHKAEVVTVRAMALQIALHERFSSPAETYHAYLLRCDLVHGSPVGSDFPEERLRFAEGREWWAQEIISAYVTHARGAGAKTALELVRGLDQSQASEQARMWLRKVGGDQVVRDYRQAVGLPAEEASPASTDSGAA